MVRAMILSVICLFLTAFLPASAYEGEGDVAHLNDEAPMIGGMSTEGKVVNLQDHRGPVIPLRFFATWCGGCVAELPRLEREIHQAYKDQGLFVVEVGRNETYLNLA